MAGTGYRRGSPGRAAPADPHIDALDGVRAIAAFAVLIFHVAIESAAALGDDFFTGLLARGDVAVPIFFTLSGLPALPPVGAAALDRRARPGHPRLPGTAGAAHPARVLAGRGRGARAVVPRPPRRPARPGSWCSLTQTYDPDPWWAGLGPKGLAQMWSLCVEAAFYLVLPLLAAGLAAFARRGGGDAGRRARRLLLGLAVLASLSPVTVRAQPPPGLPAAPQQLAAAVDGVLRLRHGVRGGARLGGGAITPRATRPGGCAARSRPRRARCGSSPRWRTRSR